MGGIGGGSRLDILLHDPISGGTENLNVFAILSLMSALFAFFLGVFVYSQNHKKRLNQLFFCYCMSLTYFSFIEFGLRQSGTYDEALSWVSCDITIPLIPAFLLHFILAFTGRSGWLEKRSRYILVYGPAIFLMPLNSDLLYSNTRLVKEYWGWGYANEKPVEFTVLMIWGVAVAFFCLYLCLQYYLKTTGMEKRRAKFVFYGVMSFLLLGLITDGLVPYLHIGMPGLTGAAFLIGGVFFAYAIWRYELFTLSPENAVRNIVSTISDAILLVDQDKKIRWVNQAALRLLNYQESELINQPVETIFSEGDTKLKASLNKEATISDINFYVKTKSENKIPVSLSSSVLKKENGDVKGIVVILRDITERKRTEEKIISTLKELERSNKELEQFAYLASHDLQEPLRMVRSYLQLLERRYKDQLDENANEFIDYAVDGATRMQGLINDLLTYSRVGTRGKPFEPTDVETVLKHATDNLKVAIEESGAVVAHEPLPEVMADGGQMVQLMQNLIGNGIKFRGPDAPRISVSAARKGDELLFSIADNGIGVDPKNRDKIFQVFQRLHTREEYPGTGIGLAVCKKIVGRHGGRIWVESEVGHGSTFYFTMPCSGVGVS